MDGAEIAQIVAAAATLALAAVTVRMAKATTDVASETAKEAEAVSRQVGVANRQVEVSTAALRAAIRPWLTSGAPNGRPPQIEQRPPGVTQRGRDIYVGVTLKNIGNGLALLRKGVLRAHSRGESDLVEYPNTALFTDPALPPGEITTIFFRVSPQSLGYTGLTPEEMTNRPATWGSFWVDVLYTDADAEQPTWARVFVTGTELGEWKISQVLYFRGEEATPFTSVDFQ